MLNLDYRDARPIYEQVRDGLRRLMVTGAIQEGEKLPSVRSLASRLAINPNTISPWRRRATCTPCRGRAPSPPPTRGWTRGGRRSCWAALTRWRRSCCSWAWEERRWWSGCTGWKEEKRRDPSQQRGKNLRRVPGPGRPDHVGGGGLHLRPGGPQRSGQVHHPAAYHGGVPARLGLHSGGRPAGV